MSETVLDFKGLKCPLPVLKTRKAIRPLAAGSRVWIETTDPLAVIDIPNYCREDGHVLIQHVRGEDCERFLIERG